MPTKGGKLGQVGGTKTCYNWSVSSTANLEALVYAGTKGGPVQYKGVEDWDASFEEYLLEPSYWPGDDFSFLGSIDGAVGLAGPAKCTQVEISIPVADGGPPVITYTVRSMGQLVAGPAVVADPSPIVPPSVEGLCPSLSTLAAVPTVTIQENTTSITITLSIEAQEANDCSSNGFMKVDENTWSALVSYDRWVDDFTLLPALDSEFIVEIPIDSSGTPAYKFEYMKSGELTDQAVNIQTGENVGATVNLSMHMIGDVDGTPTRGTGVTKPSGGIWRPDAA